MQTKRSAAAVTPEPARASNSSSESGIKSNERCDFCFSRAMRIPILVHSIAFSKGSASRRYRIGDPVVKQAGSGSELANFLFEG